MTLTTAADKLSDIEQCDAHLRERFAKRVFVDPLLSRPMVSFQASKTRPADRWYKYKEAFSAELVQYLLGTHGISSGRLLDPFAGSGAALFGAGSTGLAADGIELLPIGQEIIHARLALARDKSGHILSRLCTWQSARPWHTETEHVLLPTLRITDGAYPPETLAAIEGYGGALLREPEPVRRVLRFALLCVLENVSYTRKDGQYLRWDLRSGRRQGARPFHKGHIPTFDEAICAKLSEIIADASGESSTDTLFPVPNAMPRPVNLWNGSCLNILPTLPDTEYDAVLTSPPYCNRYDYTRTYALELALLGVGTAELVAMRQEMLSCTVENKAKDLVGMNPAWADAVAAADNQTLLQSILVFLEGQKRDGLLNNAGIPRMVRGYFYEMACVVSECARVLKPGGLCFMVNDNVRYAGANISVDLILSDMAQALGFTVEHILVLPTGKGNSSQQMGTHGRTPLRKCVYVWRKAYSCPRSLCATMGHD